MCIVDYLVIGLIFFTLGVIWLFGLMMLLVGIWTVLTTIIGATIYALFDYDISKFKMFDRSYNA